VGTAILPIGMGVAMKKPRNAIIQTVALAIGVTLIQFPSSSAQSITPIDAATARQVTPDAQMSQDAYTDSANAASTPGWTPIDNNPNNWQQLFINAGLRSEINSAIATGFYARVYQNAFGDITIAYRSTTGGNELLHTDWPAQQGSIPAQYDYAAQLAGIVKQTYPKAIITVTGHSLGGGLATYAAQQVPGISNVVIFNSARPPILSSVTLGGVNQINVVVPGDAIGNPKAGGDPVWGFGYLPGKTYQVTSTIVTAEGKLSPGVSKNTGNFAAGSHSLQGIIGGLCAASPSSSCTQTQANTPTKLPTSSWSPTIGSAPPQPHQAPPQQRTVTGSGYQSPPASYGSRYIPTTASPTFSSVAPAVYRPGGISLNKAAAERMSLNIDLEGIHYSNGQVVLAGLPNKGSGMDAALFLTTLRMACESNDPTFSLDPDNPQAWSEEGQAVIKSVWDNAKRDFEFTPNIPANRGRNATIPDGLTLQTLSIRRDFPILWAKMSPWYPDLKARLVFHPEWLSQTRVGEILYRADVLLKELSSGVSLLNSSSTVRANQVKGYIPGYLRSGVEARFSPLNAQGVIRNSRLWFDLIPQNALNADPAPELLPVLDPSRNPQMYEALERRGLIAPRTQVALTKAVLFTVGDSTDLSKIYPKMFIRRRDPIANRDISGTDPYLNALASDVNERTEQYAVAYRELKDLTEVFRAYVANVAIVRQDKAACDAVHDTPLYDAEKITAPLPEFHQTEMFLYVTRYVVNEGRRRRMWLDSANAVSGGIALRAQQFFDESTTVMETKVIADLDRELAKPAPAEAGWRGDSGRNFILINLRGGEGSPPESARSSSSPDASVRRISDHAFDSESYKSFAGGRYDQCVQLCLKEKTCLALAFEKHTNRCDLFDTVSEAHSSSASDIGLKEAGVPH
jgi:hypothetical protein